MRAARADVLGAVGQAAKAVVEMAHALACRDGLWVLNEKKLIERVGLQELHARFGDVPMSGPALVGWVDEVSAAIRRSRPAAAGS